MRVIADLRHPAVPKSPQRVLNRRAARGIVLRDGRLLLLYTERYNDFSLPGGGVDAHEELETALARELEEETGARNVRVLDAFGRVDELRPHWHPEYPFMAMKSFIYRCEIDAALGEARMESYERDAGMRVAWTGVEEAIAHNHAVMARGEASMGLSIQRETLVFERIRDELFAGRQVA